MLVNLAYGRTGLPVEFPDDRTTVIEPTLAIEPVHCVKATKNQNSVQAGHGGR